MKFLFWFSFLFILYTYVGYPCVLYIWSRLFPKKVLKAYPSEKPEVSVVIAARNEEKHIGGRIEDLLKQDYPPERMEVIIVSDGSTDRTNQIVKARAVSEPSEGHPSGNGLRNLTLIELPEGRGKANALNIGVKKAKSEFIVFTDARQRFESCAIKELVANFNDPRVGCVSGELVFYDDSDTHIKAEMGFYWNLEKRVRKMEGMVHSVAGATGAIYAIRKDLFDPLPQETILDDVYTPMSIVFKGLRTVFDGHAIAYDTVSKDFAQERKRKVRTLLGNYQLASLLPSLLSPIRNPIFWQFVSHKFFRLFVPFFFLIFILSALLTEGFIYTVAFFLSVLTLLSPFAGGLTSSWPQIERFRKLGQTFVFLNYFALVAFLRFITPGRRAVW